MNAKEVAAGGVPLRERQKANRRRRIVEAARREFLARGYNATTIEQIAAVAEVSPVTVYNHYGTKGGVLLAVVADSDARLIAKLERLRSRMPTTPVELAWAFSRIINEHAFSYLNRRLWRRVLATAVLEAASEFGRGYVELDRRLVALLATMFEEQKRRGRIAADRDCDTLAEVVYHVHYARFIQFACDEGMSEETRDLLVRRDLAMVTGAVGSRGDDDVPR